jgi:probable HAF family extracellular repeat protein
MFRKLFASPHRRSVPCPFRKLVLEALEDRLAPAVYSLTDMGKFSAGYNATFSSSAVINSAGQVVGTSSASSGSSQAVLYSNGQLTNLGTLPGENASFASGINDSGQIVGSAGPTSQSWTKAFLYSNGHMTDLNSLVTSGPTGVLAPVAINDSGQIAGNGFPPTSGTGAAQAFLFSKGTVTFLGSFSSITHFSEATGINASGQVVGFSDSSSFDKGNNTEHAFVYSNGQLIDLGTLAGNSDKYNSHAAAINNSGQVVGYSDTSSGGSDAFLYSNGQMIDLGTPAGYSSSFATAINNSGQIVGFSLSSHALRAFLYSNSKWTDLNSLLPAGTSVTLTNAVGINDNGQIVATGSDGHSYLLTPQQTTGTVISNGTVSPNALTVSNNGQQVTVSATVNTDGSPAATGNVVFSLVGPNGAVVSDSPTGVAIGSNGQASDMLTLPGGAVAGAYTLQVAYTNNNHTTTQAFTGALHISSIPVNVALSGVTPTKLAAGAHVQDVTATATVTRASGSGAVNEGTVTFTLLNGATQIGRSVQVQVVNGTAQLTNSNPLVVPANTPGGTYTIRAAYSDATGQFAANRPATAQLTITSHSSPTPGPTLPPSIPDPIQQLVQDVVLMWQSLSSGDIGAFGQALQDYESLVVAVELEILMLNDLAQFWNS